MRRHLAGWETSYLVTARPTPAATTGIGPGSAATQAEIPGAAHMQVEVVEGDGTMEVTTTTTSRAPVRLTMGGGREVRRMLLGPLIVEVVIMEEAGGTMEVADGTMEEEDGTMGVEDGTMEATGTVEGLDITLATTMAMAEGGVSETASVLDR